MILEKKHIEFVNRVNELAGEYGFDIVNIDFQYNGLGEPIFEIKIENGKVKE